MGRGMDISLEEGQEAYLGTGARCFSGGGQLVKQPDLKDFPLLWWHRFLHSYLSSSKQTRLPAESPPVQQRAAETANGGRISPSCFQLLLDAHSHADSDCSNPA